MSTPFDAATKHLIQAYPADWLALAGVAQLGSVELIDADVSTVSTMADKVMLIHGTTPGVAHVEMQASYDADLPERMLMYNVLLRRRHRVPVTSVVVLLRHSADGPTMRRPVRLVDTAGKRSAAFC